MSDVNLKDRFELYAYTSKSMIHDRSSLPSKKNLAKPFVMKMCRTTMNILSEI